MYLSSCLRILVLVYTFYFTSWNVAHGQEYIVKQSEILSRIARRHLGAPTYSNLGALSKILILNPEITNPDLIYPGKRLKLDGASLTFRGTEKAFGTGYIFATKSAHPFTLSLDYAQVNLSFKNIVFIKSQSLSLGLGVSW